MRKYKKRMRYPPANNYWENRAKPLIIVGFLILIGAIIILSFLWMYKLFF